MTNADIRADVRADIRVDVHVEVEVELELPGGARECFALTAPGPWWVGRDPSCDVVLDSGFVSRQHARIALDGGQLHIHDTSANGTLVDDVRVIGAERASSLPCELQVGPYRLHVRRRADEPAPVPEHAAHLASDDARAFRRRIHRAVLEHLDLAKLDRLAMDPAAIRPEVEQALASICQARASSLPRGTDLAALQHELCDEILGLGPLEGLLADPEVNEIMVIGPQLVFVERAGRVLKSDKVFTDEDAVRAVIERIVTPLGRRIDEATPMVDARLADGSRVNAVLPPLSRRAACLTIRKFTKSLVTMDALRQRETLDARMARFLTRAVRARLNIVVAGGTGSGKTTLLNVLSGSIASSERIITIEDAAELSLSQPHVVSLESRPANLEGRGEIGIRELLRNALRMRPDRILVGECRGGEAIDMLQAMNTGHDGSMTTTHANSPREALARLETLCLMAGLDLPLRAVRAQIASSVHLLVQLERAGDGRRRISNIAEVSGMHDSGELEVQAIFAWSPTLGFHGTGYLPECLDRFVQRGLIDDGEYL